MARRRVHRSQQTARPAVDERCIVEDWVDEHDPVTALVAREGPELLQIHFERRAMLRFRRAHAAQTVPSHRPQWRDVPYPLQDGWSPTVAGQQAGGGGS